MSRLGMGVLAVAAPVPQPGPLTADQAIARYRDLVAPARSSAEERRRCESRNGASGEIVVCAKDTTRERLPFPDAHMRAAPGDRIRHGDEVPRADGRIDAAPCGPSCPDGPHGARTNRRIWSWLHGEDPD